MCRGDRNISRLLELYAMKQFGLSLKELPTIIWETDKSIKNDVISAVDDNSIDDYHCHDKLKLNSHVNDNNVNDNNATEVETDDVSKRDTSFTREDMRDLLNEVDAFVLPTRGEGNDYVWLVLSYHFKLYSSIYLIINNIIIIIFIILIIIFFFRLGFTYS